MRSGKPKAFVDFLPEWIEEIDLEDRWNYRYAWAVKNYHEIQKARTLFPDAIAWGKWVFTDRTKVEPTVYVPCARYAGIKGWRPDREEIFDRQERLADGSFRWQLGLMSIDEYSPESPAVLAERAAKRQAKKDAAERAAMPLFADQVREEQAAT